MPIRRSVRDLAGAALTLLALSACVPRAAPPAPLPAPAPQPAPLPPRPASAPAPAADWATGPLSPGDWSYRLEAGVPTAVFGGAGYGPSFAITCVNHRIAIVLTGAEGDAIVVRTSFGQRRLPAVADRNQTAVTLPASDPLLDQIAFSRGRFLVTVEGGPSLVVPAWPEFARVVEECRGQ
jgi:hypothetical protein